MRVTRVLFILILLTIAVPVGLGLLAQRQSAASASEPITPGASVTDAQLAQIASARGVSVDQLRSFATQFQQGGGFAAQTNTNTQATSLALLGTVEANEVVSLNFLTSGDVAEVLVVQGDTVEAGQVVARLDGESAQIAYNDAMLSLEDAELNLQTLQEPASETDIELAQLSIASAQASYSDAANSTSDSELQQLQMNVDQAQRNYDLEVQERANMSGTDEQLALQDAAVGAASFNLEIARLRLQDAQTPDNSGSLWSAGVRVQMAQLEYEQLLNGASPSQLTSAQLSVESAEANVADAETTLERLDLIAPTSGVITALNIEPGTSVSPATAAMEVTDLSTLWLNAPLHELDLDQVREGMSATVVFDALPDVTFNATLNRIGWIGVESDGIVEYDVWFAVDTNGDTRIRPGMTGEATLDLTQDL